MTTKMKIKLKSKGDVWYEEAVASASVLPGSFVAIAADETVANLADDAAGDLPAIIVTEKSNFGETVTDAIAADSRVYMYRVELGQEYNAVITTGETIANRDLLTYGTGGALKKAAEADIAQFQAIEAITTAPAGTLLAVKAINPVTV